ncbi:hypothetical protein GCM10007301_25070 [Azorhizobium oxalatiphilum]|uniref:Uncharacterized protein n=1 Tax=Azorhizobium oxalatiphilum TaxID=980631 RepID=A0A917FBU9_9HYPH|nr:hypothetical protein GCM10007301_25070 [Azorhizobium oxalatiphilum]
MATVAQWCFRKSDGEIAIDAVSSVDQVWRLGRLYPRADIKGAGSLPIDDSPGPMRFRVPAGLGQVADIARFPGAKPPCMLGEPVQARRWFRQEGEGARRRANAQALNW